MWAIVRRRLHQRSASDGIRGIHAGTLIEKVRYLRSVALLRGLNELVSNTRHGEMCDAA
jgi:hypothetical protein